MANTLFEKITETLKDYNRIDFNLQYHHKGHFIEVEFGEFTNKDCGEIYVLLEEWLGYGDLNNFLLAHDCFYNFSGWFEYENEEIILFLIFSGPYDEEFEPILVEYSQNFIFEELGLESLINSIPDFKCENFFVEFEFNKGQEIEVKEIYYDFRSQIKISLEQEKLVVLKNYLTEFVLSNVPSLYIEFPCNQIWCVECFDNQLSITLETSPIKIKWDEIYSTK